MIQSNSCIKVHDFVLVKLQITIYKDMFYLVYTDMFYLVYTNKYYLV